jgi:hypothetical protein
VHHIVWLEALPCLKNIEIIAKAVTVFQEEWIEIDFYVE